MRLLDKLRNISSCKNISRQELESLFKTLSASTSTPKSKKKCDSKPRKIYASQTKNKSKMLV